MAKTIQRVELNEFYYSPIHCPFCGTRIHDHENCFDPQRNTCAHLLFVAHDEGFEYRAARFDDNLGIKAVSNDDLAGHVGDELSYDALTNKVTIPDAIKIATYVGAPSGFGTYFGFAPIDTE